MRFLLGCKIRQADRSGRSVTNTSGDIGHRHRWRCRRPEAAAMRRWRASRRPSCRGPQATCPPPASMAARPTAAPTPGVETWPQRGCHRMPPLALTSRPATRSGDASAGRVVGSFLGEGSSQAAGGRRSRASGGRVWWNAARQWVNCRGWARRVAPGGRLVSACRVRCSRAWRPCWGG
jgi:hypothetical protein